MPLTGFVSQDIFQVPGDHYSIVITKAIQPVVKEGQTAGIIIDIDVSSSKPETLEYNEDLLKRSLNEMRWLKNKAFWKHYT